MRSRAVRHLQEPARWVPEALQAILFAPWSPHMNLPGRPRLQRPAHEEPLDAGTLPRFIETPNSHNKTEDTASRDAAGCCRAANKTLATGGDSHRTISARFLLPPVQTQTHRCEFLVHRCRNPKPTTNNNAQTTHTTSHFLLVVFERVSFNGGSHYDSAKGLLFLLVTRMYGLPTVPVYCSAKPQPQERDSHCFRMALGWIQPVFFALHFSKPGLPFSKRG